MKKLIITIAAFACITTACKDAHKTGGATRDSSASHGNNGPALNARPSTTKGAGVSTGQSGSSTGTTDTSTIGVSTTEPTVDTTKDKPIKKKHDH